MSRLLAVVVLAMTASLTLGYTGAVVTVTDVESTDVPGPQPIRIFPAPVAANMNTPRLAFDNYDLLDFSTGNTNLSQRNFVTMPLVGAGVTVNNVTYQGRWSAGGFKVLSVNNALAPQTGLYTNIEQTPTDNRFPAGIPRPGRYAGYDYTAVQFDLYTPAREFGVYVAMNSNQWSASWSTNDDNNIPMYSFRKLWVAVLGETDTFATAQYQEITCGAMYAPFIHVAWNGTDAIKSVCVVQDSSVESDAPFGFFDVYMTPTNAGDIDGDGGCNIFDIFVVAEAWGTSRGQPGFNALCDLDCDGSINIFDIFVIAENWGL